jgi:hypothetical protein
VALLRSVCTRGLLKSLPGSLEPGHIFPLTPSHGCASASSVSEPIPVLMRVAPVQVQKSLFLWALDAYDGSQVMYLEPTRARDCWPHSA